MELHRKPFEEMRWEEVWDTALRIRNLFLKTPIPQPLHKELHLLIDKTFSGKAVSVRSSAPGEDSADLSFAGLHESYVNVKGTESILDHLRLVWASLWSDRALLYRRELGMDVLKSTMAVVIQEMVIGERSGVVFGENPADSSQSVIEAVYGLNQGLVDGTIEPDRWTLFRKTGDRVSHQKPSREKALRATEKGTRVEDLPHELQSKPPLNNEEVQEVYNLAMKAEGLFGTPQDVEWTYEKEWLTTLQARPITSTVHEKDDQRPWYLSLHRSFENLKGLRKRIEKELQPAMEKEALDWSRKKLDSLSDEELADEIEHRIMTHTYWLERYKEDCIPFAHGMRLFGQVYNDMMHPEAPFEFVNLLRQTGMVSLTRNRMLEDLASQVRNDQDLEVCLRQGRLQDCNPQFKDGFEKLMKGFGDLPWGKSRFERDPRQIIGLLLEMAHHEADRQPLKEDEKKKAEEDFLSRFPPEERDYALEMLDLARASYRLRDDDNIYLGRIEGQRLAAVEEGKGRLQKPRLVTMETLEDEDIVAALRGSKVEPKATHPTTRAAAEENFRLKARQIVGQPAGAGIAVGKARVILDPGDLFLFKKGEILVCDAVDPAMTFVVPLAAGIVERRGGMLIHGAIIAREYGLPCVTGAPGAAEWIRTGDTITVDGFLGIVVIGGDPL
jgi:pyruvate,water dikinase